MCPWRARGSRAARLQPCRRHAAHRAPRTAKNEWRTAKSEWRTAKSECRTAKSEWRTANSEERTAKSEWRTANSEERTAKSEQRTAKCEQRTAKHARPAGAIPATRTTRRSRGARGVRRPRARRGSRRGCLAGVRTLGGEHAWRVVGASARRSVERLGARGVLWQRLARGEDARPLVPWVESRSKACWISNGRSKGSSRCRSSWAVCSSRCNGSSGPIVAPRCSTPAAARLARSAHADGAVAGADARSQNAAHARAAGSRIESAVGRHRSGRACARADTGGGAVGAVRTRAVPRPSRSLRSWRDYRVDGRGPRRLAAAGDSWHPGAFAISPDLTSRAARFERLRPPESGRQTGHLGALRRSGASASPCPRGCRCRKGARCASMIDRRGVAGGP